MGTRHTEIAGGDQVGHGWKGRKNMGFRIRNGSLPGIPSNSSFTEIFSREAAGR